MLLSLNFPFKNNLLLKIISLFMHILFNLIITLFCSYSFSTPICDARCNLFLCEIQSHSSFSEVIMIAISTAFYRKNEVDKLGQMHMSELVLLSMINCFHRWPSRSQVHNYLPYLNWIKPVHPWNSEAYLCVKQLTCLKYFKPFV